MFGPGDLPDPLPAFWVLLVLAVIGAFGTIFGLLYGVCWLCRHITIH